MAGGNSTLVVKIGANIEALKAALALGQTELIKTAAGATALASSLNGQKLEQNALQMAVAIKAVGGAATLSAQEAKKADAIFTQWLEKAAKTGKEVSPELAKIAAETKKIAEESKKAEDGAGSFFAKLAGGVTVGTLVADALKSIGSAAVEAFTSAAMALPNMIGKAIELGSSLFDMSLKTGASVENLSRLRYVSSQTGISMDSFINSMAKMNMNLGQTGSKAEELGKKLHGLGLDMGALKNQRPDEALIAVMTALEKLPTRADQAAAGMAIFGKGFKDMAGLTQESITDLMAAADELGLVYSTEFAAAADIAGDAIARIKMQWEALTIRIGAAFLPAVIGIAETFSGAFRDAINDANKSLGDMGGGSGFLATVARAMGTGNEALAAQIQLYEYLRDAIIALIRYGVEPLIAAFGVIMSWLYQQKLYYDEIRLGLLMLEQGYNRVAMAAVALKNITANAADYEKAMAPMRKAFADTAKEIAEVGKAVVLDAVKSAEWAKTATQDNAVIEAALAKVEGKHLDIAEMIKQNAALARAASGSTSEGLEGENKKLEQLLESGKALSTAFATMFARGASGEEMFKALGSKASSLQAAFDELGQDVPQQFAWIVQAFKEMGQQIERDKTIESAMKALGDWMRKYQEDLQKDQLALVEKQKTAINAAFSKNLDVQIKAQDDLQKLEEDSLEKRLAVVRREMQSRRDALDENASNYEAALATVNRLEEESAREATEAWLDHVAQLKKAMGPSFLDIFNNALKGIPDIITAAFTGGGGVGGAISGILSDLGGQLGTKLGGMLARGLDGILGKLGPKIGGAIFDMIPGIGGALGSMIMPALDKAWGWISKREGRQVNDLRDAYIQAAGGFEALAEKARKAGIELNSSSAFQRASTTEAWQKAVAELDAALKKSTEDRKKLMDAAMANERVATKAFIDEMIALAKAGGEGAKEAQSYFAATLKNAAGGLTTMFAGLESAATASARKASEALHRAAGMSEADAKKAAESVTGIFVKTQAQATGLAAAIAGTFGKMIENGATFKEALEAIKGPLDTMRKQLQLTGLQGGGAFENLSRMGEIASGTITGPLVEAISGANEALKGLANSGILDQEMFSGLATTATDAYNQIIAQGADGQAALQMIQPTLQTIWELQQQFGYAVDDATQALIDEAVEAGTVGEAHMSAADRTAKSMEKVATIMEAIARKMGVELTAAAQAGAKGIDDAFNKVDPSVPPPWQDWGPPPDIEIDYSFNQTGEGPPGMAHGGVVYAATGFVPKGTDTVPAMLTPGERVLSVQQNKDYEALLRSASATLQSAMAVTIAVDAGPATDAIKTVSAALEKLMQQAQEADHLPVGTVLVQQLGQATEQAHALDGMLAQVGQAVAPQVRAWESAATGFQKVWVEASETGFDDTKLSGLLEQLNTGTLAAEKFKNALAQDTGVDEGAKNALLMQIDAWQQTAEKFKQTTAGGGLTADMVAAMNVQVATGAAIADKFRALTSGITAATGFNEGGVVYAARGWAPTQTDTVPAMLTPGERVLSVQQNKDYEALLKNATTNLQAAMNVKVSVDTTAAGESVKAISVSVAELLKNLRSAEQAPFAEALVQKLDQARAEAAGLTADVLQKVAPALTGIIGKFKPPEVRAPWVDWPMPDLPIVEIPRVPAPWDEWKLPPDLSDEIQIPQIPAPWEDWPEPPDLGPYAHDFTPGYGEGPAGEIAWGGEQATGGDYLVSRPTMFLAGEAGAERVTFTPAATPVPAPAAAPVNVAITIHALDPVGLKKVVENEVVPLLVSAYRRNVNGARTETRKELVE